MDQSGNQQSQTSRRRGYSGYNYYDNYYGNQYNPGYGSYSNQQYYNEGYYYPESSRGGRGNRGRGTGSFQQRGRGGHDQQRNSHFPRTSNARNEYDNGLPEDYYGNVRPQDAFAVMQPESAPTQTANVPIEQNSGRGRRGNGGGQRHQGSTNWKRNSARPLGESGLVPPQGEVRQMPSTADTSSVLPGQTDDVLLASGSAGYAEPVRSSFGSPSLRRGGQTGNNRGGFRRQTVKKEDKNQRERLIDEMSKERLECQFCVDRIWAKQSIWSCDSCFNVFHLKCVKGWATTSKKDSEDGTWRCMICQTSFLEEPRKYLCFCRKQENPEWNPSLTPHTCGELCEKSNVKFPASRSCEHACTELCHPGPCPPCLRMVTRECACGKTKIHEQCSTNSVQLCSNTCDKPLNCGKHLCTSKCHLGPCGECDVKVEKSCFCGRDIRVVSCLEAESITYADGFPCGMVCGNLLSCGNHRCEEKCHKGECRPCLRAPGFIKACPCGNKSLDELGAKPRKSCLDPIATCGATCGKLLSCGIGKSRHFCEMSCHDGQCPPCGKKTAVPCQCGSSTQVVPCSDLTPTVRMWSCKKKCNKKMNCGRHKCENLCCNFDEHVCLKICGKKLSCGLHNCEDPCGHPGFCRRCYNTSFEERTCRCGFTVQHPPIPCGAPMLDCPRPCTLEHACGHPPTHTCHTEEECPPCTFLCEKMCFGGHESRRNLPCYSTGVSCGKPCGKLLRCGVHNCRKICHAGDCESVGEKCVQPCSLLPRKCGHPCNTPCHGQTKCPFSTCKSVMTVTCECRLRQKKVPCYQMDKLIQEYLRRKQDDQPGAKLPNLDSLRHALPTDILECDEECRKVERNKSLALALNIDENRETAVGSPGPPVYSEELKKYARENTKWTTQVENSLQSLVEAVRRCNAKRVHSFQPMKYEQRKFLHELAGFYGCKTVSYDEEPLRSVVAVAEPDKIVTPTSTLYSLVAAERPLKQVAKFPSSVLKGPVSEQEKVVEREKERVVWPINSGVETGNRFAALKREPPKPVIDYFDLTEN